MYYPQGLPADGLPRLVLLSDAFVTTEIYRHTAGAVTETEDFRHIYTPIPEKDKEAFNYAPLKILQHDEKPSEEKLSKSAKYTLLRRGSVFVAKDATSLTAIQKALDMNPWRKAGFNHCFPDKQSN